MRIFKTTFFCLLTLVMLTCQAPVAENYMIRIKPTITGNDTVDVKIATNIPGSIVLAANLALQGQEPDDTFIGTEFIRVPITDGIGKATIDGSIRALPHGSELPAGDYDVEVSFYPRWPDNSAAAKAAGIKDTIEAKASVTLSASGQSSSSAKGKAEARRWVMENFYMGYPWKPEFWRNKFGELQQVEYRGSGNPEILKMFYIESIDMTLLVNDLKKEITTYRMGLAHQ